MKLDPANLFRLLKNHPGGLNSKEILTQMGQKQKMKAQLRKILRHMAQEGWVFKDNSRYQLTDQGKEASGAFAAASEKKREKEKPTAKRRIQEAFFKAQGSYLLARGTGQRLELAPSSEREFLTGDLVGFEETPQGAKINRFIERSIEQIKGRLRFEGEQLFFDPLSADFPKGFKASGLKPTEKLDGQKAMGKVLAFPDARVRIEGLISKDENDKAAYRSIQIQNQIPFEFPQAVVEQARSFGTEPSPSPNRTDLRDLPIVTIDGADAKDFDDAICGEETPDGDFRLWVSIADVAEYVTLKSDLDKEAAQRGTSVYMPGTVVPMLPEELSNGLCSLNPEVNRLTLTAEMLLGPKGEVKDCKIYESTIKSRARLTYGEVDQLFETGSWDKDAVLTEKLMLYRKWALILRGKREKRGAIAFSLPEAVFDFAPTGEVTGIHQSFQSEAQKLIEQFMLEANENVGHFCEKQKLPILWRNHPPPLPAKQELLKSLLWNLNIRVPFLQRGKDYNEVLAQAHDNPNRIFVENALLRSMSLANYGAKREGHFGLAATHYLHFTSPIRRYPDLVVHRALKAHLAGEKPPALARFLGETTSERERLAKQAERDGVKLKRMVYMSGFIGQDYKARITGLNRAGIYCEVAEPYVEGFIPFKGLVDDHYDWDDQIQRALGKRSHRSLAIGQELQVLLTGLQLDYKSLNFAWIAWIDPA
ncbi:MAG: VacB/RNase II family 3'-5' exoribonuclease [bacterium]|nr:VacB/RNase II family 3'-5' exoribonuclease [bacterium]